ncbi:MAG: hypothetical protein IJK71_12775 [Clostridia bacterium]|nr:hypothetical protein [Clostridia bacterium]
MRQMDFVDKINTLEEQCLHFEMSESDYDDLFSYVIARRRIRHFKSHYYDQPMNYFDLIGVEVRYICPQMAEIVRIMNTEVKELKEHDIIIRINQQTDFFSRIRLDCREIKVYALRNLYGGDTVMVEETFPFPEMRNTGCQIQARVFDQSRSGMIRLFDFNFSVQQFEEILKKWSADGIDTVVFDLRGNMGGSVKRANKALDMLLPEESVKYSYVDKKNTHVVVKTASDTIYRFGKIYILTDRFTLSSAEIFTSALRCNLGAVVAGETSGGKGTIITPLEINSESYVMFPKYEYFTARGETVEGVGIKPDLPLEGLKAILPEELCAALL